MNYEKDITIDESALDLEWLNQAPLVLKYARNMAEQKYDVAKLREQKKTLRSELILQVNENPEECVMKKKPNTADIEAYYRNNEEYKNLIKTLLLLEKELEFTELAYQEISWTRKKALENLVILHGQQYFAGPSVPHDLSSDVQKSNEQKKKNEKSNQGVAAKMQRKRNK